MRASILIGSSAELLLTHDELGFERLLRKVPSAVQISVATYNIDEGVLKVLAQAPVTANIELVTNIPGRFPGYRSRYSRGNARNQIAKYRMLLEPSRFGAGIDVFYNLANHSKIIIVDDMAYVGSANFSDASSRSFECGVLITDAAMVERLRLEVFSVVRDAGVAVLPEGVSDFALALRGTADAIESAHREFVESVEYDHDPFGRTHHQLTFSQFGATTLEALLDDLVSLLDDAPDTERIEVSVHTVSRALNLTRDCLQCGVIREASEFNEDTFAQRLLEMNKEAYDENLDAASDAATQAAADRREELYENAKRELRNLLLSSRQLVIALRNAEKDAISLIQAEASIDNT